MLRPNQAPLQLRPRPAGEQVPREGVATVPDTLEELRRPPQVCPEGAQPLQKVVPQAVEAILSALRSIGPKGEGSLLSHTTRKLWESLQRVPSHIIC